MGGGNGWAGMEQATVHISIHLFLPSSSCIIIIIFIYICDKMQKMDAFLLFVAFLSAFHATACYSTHIGVEEREIPEGQAKEAGRQAGGQWGRQ